MAAIVPPGVYVPTLAFFTEDDKVDVPTTKRHAVRLAKAGVAGLVVHGSNGEAVHLRTEERSVITRATKAALEAEGYGNMPVLVGCSANSVTETVDLCKQAKEDGGAAALTLPPSYYASLHEGQTTLINFFREVADESPIPILIYNYPGATQNVDMNSDTIIELASHKNIIGCKLTCGNTGKLNRVVAGTVGMDFQVFGGSADFILQTMVGGGAGTIAGMANVAPEACVKLVELGQQEKFAEARELQARVAHSDGVLIKGGLIACKKALSGIFGYGGSPRKPLAQPTKAQIADLTDSFQFEALEIALAKFDESEDEDDEEDEEEDENDDTPGSAEESD